MLRLAALAVVLGGLAAAALLVPVHGRTVAARWSAAEDPGAFLSSAWDELRGPQADEPAPKEKKPARAKARAEKHAARATERASEPRDRSDRRERAEPADKGEPERNERPERRERAAQARPAAPAPTPAPATPPRAPVERHTESDRAALDRLLSERAR